jgi:hypothetical protein
MSNNRKLVIKFEADLEKLGEDLQSYLFRVLSYMLQRRIVRKKVSRVRKRTPLEPTEYTADSVEYTVKNTTNTQRYETIGDEDNYQTESYVRCANPYCDEMFPYQKRGNQEKKYCSPKCKDDVNNERKKVESSLGY